MERNYIFSLGKQLHSMNHTTSSTLESLYPITIPYPATNELYKESEVQHAIAIKIQFSDQLLNHLLGSVVAMNCTSYDFDFTLQYIHIKKQTLNTKQTNQKLIQAKRVCRNCTNVQAIAKPSLVQQDPHPLRHSGQMESLSGGRSKEGRQKNTLMN